MFVHHALIDDLAYCHMTRLSYHVNTIISYVRLGCMVQTLGHWFLSHMQCLPLLMSYSMYILIHAVAYCHMTPLSYNAYAIISLVWLCSMVLQLKLALLSWILAAVQHFNLKRL